MTKEDILKVSLCVLRISDEFFSDILKTKQLIDY